MSGCTCLCTMPPGFLLYILPILFIASISSLELYDDSAEESQGRAATPAPILQLRYLLNPKLKGNRIIDNGVDQFLINVDKGRGNDPVLAKTAEDVLMDKLMGLLTQSMQELDRKIKKINKLKTENKEKMDVSEVVGYVNRSYGDLVAEYKNIEKRQRSMHPVDILLAYDRVRKSNIVAASILHMASGNQFVDQKVRQPPWKNKISWSYYDESII